MSKTLKQIAQEDLVNLAAQMKSLEVRKYQLTQEATQQLQVIESEMQAVQSRIQLLTDATTVKSK